MFQPGELQKVIEALPADGPSNALVGTVNEKGIKVVVQMKRGDRWEVQGTLEREWDGDVKAGATVIARW